MKPASLILFLLFLFVKSDAQTNVYHPMADSNASWCESYTWGSCGAVDDYVMWIQGDTIYNSLTYHKLYASGKIYCQGPPSYYYNQYRGAFREDTAQKKVYFLPESQVAEILLYDFDVAVGDTSLAPNAPILRIDSVLVNGNYRKKFIIDTTTTISNQGISYIEGIGCTMGFYQYRNFAVEYIPVLHSYFENSLEIFLPDSLSPCNVLLRIPEINEFFELSVFPNPASGNFIIEFGKTIRQGDIEIKDILGNTVFAETISNRSQFSCENLPAGIFLVMVTDENGRRASKRIVHYRL